ncbi:hypothetical protein AB6A40_009517 [Gnathostoma spinigerum]|uniref:Uncharacterized protein n=1 Tax=Gnathostoma spinigerum TaxID=75299 RepID=A0ABD6ES81_9BILA
MLVMKLPLLLILLVTYCVTGWTQQSTAVKGRLVCGTEPATNVTVRLMDNDRGIDRNDKMDSTYTDENGEFSLSGDETELTTIDPELIIYHQCNKGINPCPRRWKFGIPDKYIFAGDEPRKVFDIGTLNLEVEIERESFDCLF